MIGHRGQPDFQLRPFGLQPALHPGQHARRAARGGGHHEVMLAQPCRDAIVEHHAVLVQHQPVAAFADLELAPGIVYIQFSKATASGPWISILPSVEASRMPTPLRTARHCGARRRAGPRPAAGSTRAASSCPRLEQRAAPGVPFCAGRSAHRIEELAQLASGEGAERDRRVVRPVGGGASLGMDSAQGLRQDGHAVDVAELALIRAEAHRRIALDMLDGFEASRAASRMSDAATSFWKSTNCLGRAAASDRPPATAASARPRRWTPPGERAALSRRRAGGAGGFGASARVACASARHRSNSPAAAPRWPRPARFAGHEAGLALQPLRLAAGLRACRCSTGLRPPDIASRSHGKVATRPPDWPLAYACTSTDATRRLPCAAITTAPAITVTLRRRAASGRMPSTGAGIHHDDPRRNRPDRWPPDRLGRCW